MSVTPRSRPARRPPYVSPPRSRICRATSSSTSSGGCPRRARRVVARDDERADLRHDARVDRGLLQRPQLGLDVERLAALAPAHLVARVEELADLVVALARRRGAALRRLARAGGPSRRGARARRGRSGRRCARRSPACATATSAAAATTATMTMPSACSTPRVSQPCGGAWHDGPSGAPGGPWSSRSSGRSWSSPRSRWWAGSRSSSGSSRADAPSRSVTGASWSKFRPRPAFD